MNKKKGRRGQRLLTALLCLALCAADIMPVSMTAWASEQMPQNIAADDNVSGSAAEDENDIPVRDLENGAKKEEGDSDSEEADTNEGKGDSGEFTGSDNSDDSAEDGDLNDSGNQDTPDDEEDSEDWGTLDDREDSDGEEADGDSEDSKDAEKTEADVNGVVNQTAGLEDAFAADYIAYDTDLTDDITWSIDKNGKLTVEGTGDFNRVSISAFSHYPPWYDYILDITSAEVNVTGMTDASYLFFCCYYLEEVDLTHFDTSSIINMNSMFSDCDNLTSLDLSNFDTHNVTDMKGMFSLCWKLSDLKFGTSFDTKKVTDMTIMFLGCESLTDLDLSFFNTEKVTKMSSMFFGCSGLTSLDLSSFDVSLNPDMEDFFTNCTALSRIRTPRSVQAYVGLPKTDKEDIWYQYDGTKIKTVLSLPRNLSESTNLIKNEKPDTKVPYIEAVKEKVEYINVETVNTDDITILYYDEEGVCTEDKGNYTTNIKELDTSEPGPVILTVTYTEPSTGAELETEIELTIKVPTRIVVYMDKTMYLLNEMINTDDLTVFYYDDLGNPNWIGEGFTTNASEIDTSTPGIKTLIVTYIDPATGEELTAEIELNVIDAVEYGISNDITWKIDKNGKLTVEGTGDFEHKYGYQTPWYSYTSSITSAEINVAGMTDASRMFQGCNNLNSLDLSNFNTNKVTNMSGMFSGCSSLTKLDVSSFNTSNVTNMEGMFSGCSILTELDVSNFKTDNVTNMGFMFYGCENLAGIDVSGFNTSKVTSIEGMFEDCASLTMVDLSSFDLGKIIVTVGLDVSFATGVTGLFFGCTNLNTVYTPLYLPALTEEDHTSLLTVTASEVWYRADGTKIRQLPIDLSYSIVVTKGFVPDTSEHITASKRKNTYKLGEEFNDDDLTVMYYDGNNNGKVVRISSGFTTNKDEISTSAIGKQTLIITYQGLTAEVEIFISNVLDNNNVTITIPGCVYDKTAQTPAPTVVYHASGQDDIILEQGVDYKVFYQNNVEAGDSAKLYISGMNEYYGTIMQTFVIEKAEAPGPEELVFYVFYSSARQGTYITDVFTGYGTKTGYKVGVPVEDTTIAGDVLQSIPDINQSGYLTYYLQENGVGGDFVTIPVTVSFKNYEDALLNVKIILRDKDDKNIAIGDSNNIHWVIDENGKLTVTGTGDFQRQNGNQAPWSGYTSRITSAEIDVTGMTDASYMFSNCINLTALDLRDFNFSNVTDMSHMFYYCSSLTDLDLGNLGTGNVKDMSYMFYYCEKLTNVKLRGLDTSSVENMGYMFYRCVKLTSLNLTGINTGNVTNMSHMFYDCSGLTDLNLGNLDTGNVKDMSDMFSGCSGLTSLHVSSFNTGRVTNMSHMFFGCSALNDLDVSSFSADSVTDVSYMFASCKGLKSLNLSNFNSRQATSMYAMFNYCTNLKTLDISGFDTGNVVDMSSMFSSCGSLTSLDTGSFDTRNVRKMSSMFSGCKGLTSLDLGNFNTALVTDMRNMFSGCSGLTSLDVGSFDTGEVTEVESMFGDCKSLNSLDLSSFDVGKMEYIDSDFLNGCTALSTIYTPRNLGKIVRLPVKSDLDQWYRVDGNYLTNLPMYLDYSIVITRNNTPEVTVSITASKTKTAYICGETVNINDITVTYFNSKGEIRKLTEGFTTNVDSIDMSVPGIKELIITYVDPETKTTENPEGTALTTTLELTVSFGLTKENVTITLYDEDLQLYYNGFPQNPEPIVTVRIGGADKTLVLKEDYTVSYANNINAGEKAVLIITGSGDYSGTVESYFTIASAALVITACDLNLAIGDPLPEGKDYLYQATGLVTGDVLLKEPSFTCDITDTTELGTYPIIPNGADAGTNYEITYRNGTLTVAEERVIYKVSFNMMGHGTNIAPITGIKAGSLITEPKASESEGYIFTGWYKDTTFASKQKWNFETDTVQADTILYACWIEKAAEDGNGIQLSIQDIQDQYFTGSAIKPTVYVYTADGRTLLKSGKDYTVKYADNTNVGEARVTITGKGNYKETVDKSFTILPADISADDGNVAAGFTLKYTEQLVVNKSKVQKPFTSLKYKKAMKAGADYEVKLTALTAYDADEVAVPEGSVVSASNGTTLPTIPKGCHGTFRMTVTGKGNYTGSFAKTIIVAGKNQLMKNAAVSIGKKQKSLVYDGKTAVILTPGWYDKDKKKYYKVNENGIISDTPETDAKSIFTVKAGNEYLKSGLDYTVSYTNNKAVGTATMTITGNPEKGYYGSKSVTFKLTGKNFSANAINVGGYVASVPYTGRAITQNKVILTPKPTADDAEPQILLYGIHYTISYKNNIKKGTATMTFTAKSESGYTGSFKKTFKITAQSIAAADVVKVGAVQSEGHEQDSIVGLSNTEGNITGYRLNGDIAYVKGGVKPSDRIVLTNSGNITLKEGTDYTVKYKNNTAITTPDMEDSKKPYMTVTGKGNYAGTLTVYFDITQAELTEGQITVTPMILNTKNNYEYKPSVKVTDSVSGKVLSAGENKDYTITYENNGQENVTKYVNGDVSAAQPMAVVKVPSSGTGSYKLAEGVSEIKVPLPIYQTKLTSSNLYVIVSEDPAQITYTGDTGTDERIRPVTPDVTVYYGEAAAVKAAKQNKVTDETELTKQDSAYKLIKLKEVSAVSNGQTDTASSGTGDYTVSYGANVTAGKNKGTVTITGTGVYGGSVTVKFEILKRSVYVAP